MNKKILVGTAILMASISAVVGCSKAPNNQNSNSTSGTNAQVAQHSPKDMAAFLKATQTLDFKTCNDIIETSYKVDCFKAVANHQTMQAAVSKNDPKLCDTITDDTLKQECSTQVKMNANVASQQALSSKQLYDQNNQKNAIVFGGDYAKCSTLSTQSQINDCQYNIVANTAIEKKDPTLCADINDQTLQDKCTEAYKKVVK